MSYEDQKNHAPPGWNGIVERLHAALLVTDPDHQVDQIKQKFGELCYYTTPPLSPEGRDLLMKATAESYRTCEQCGEPGTARGGWIRILCDQHHEDRGR